MRSPFWVILLAGASLGVDVLRARSNWQLSTRNFSINGAALSGPSINAASPFDHSWIESFASLGDSYSVGLGAGHAVTAAQGVYNDPLAKTTESLLTREFQADLEYRLLSVFVRIS